MNNSIKINDVIVFNPTSFESSRINNNFSKWISCEGYKNWRGNEIPFIRLAILEKLPNDPIDITNEQLSKWNISTLNWASIPCDSSSCMLVVEKESFYVKLVTLNENFKSPVDMNNQWVPVSVLEYGISVGILQVLI